MASIASPTPSDESRVALITGITGQDGSYLTELLLSKGYIVHGIIRRSSSFNTGRINHVFQDATMPGRYYYGGMSGAGNLCAIMAKVRPNEVYNLAAQSHVRVSFDQPQYTANVDAIGVVRLLDAIRMCGLEKKCRFYQASTSELYGLVQEVPQSETTPFYPRSPYAVAKQFAFWIVKNYREAYDMHLSNGILFNHESPPVDPPLSRERLLVQLLNSFNLQENFLGNLDAKRDWGHARDYVEMMWIMLQQDIPDDYVVATGEMHTVREFVEKAFAVIGTTIEWKGPAGVDQVGVDATNPERVLVQIDPAYFRLLKSRTARNPQRRKSLVGNPKPLLKTW